MELQELATRLGLALALGFVIGLERGWKERDEGEGQRAGHPSLFLRLQGCSAKHACYQAGVRCDTEFESGQPMEMAMGPPLFQAWPKVVMIRPV